MSTEPGRPKAPTVPLPSGLGSTPPTPRGPMFRRVLDTAGDGSGATAAIGDYSTAAASFHVAPTLFDIVVTRLVLFIRDAVKWAEPGYGSAPPLTNGLVIRFTDSNGNPWDLTDNRPIKTLDDWATLLTQGGGGAGSHPQDKYTGLSIVDFRAMGSNYYVSKGTRFEVICEDNFSHLEAHEFAVCGYAIR